MKEFVQNNVTVSILGKDYAVKELTLAQKNKLLAVVGEFIKKRRNTPCFSYGDISRNKVSA